MSDRHCWACGVDQHPERPNRADFESSPAYLVACLVWLDHAYPKREANRARVAEWERLERESDPEWVRARINELFGLDWPLSSAHEVELNHLIDLYKNHRKTERKAAHHGNQ